MTHHIDQYFLVGCGRCPLGGTPDCKVHRWTAELGLLRMILADSGLTEEVKWGVPCYTWQGHNVILLGAFKEHCAISFLKGALLTSTDGHLEKPGKNSQATRVIKFTHTDQIAAIEAELKAFIQEAIEVEKAGLKVPFKKNPEPVPEELEQQFSEDPVLKSAFEALTPGRQRGYILYFSAPKQSKTRTARIKKCVEKIMQGERLHDKYKGRKKES